MKTKTILPGSEIGILGGGQLGRMLAIAARRMGYRTHVYCPERDCPAATVADAITVAEYNDTKWLNDFASRVQVVTFEFENIPFDSVELLEKKVPVHPTAQALYTAQHRGREKAFLKGHGFPIVTSARVGGLHDWDAAIVATGLPAVLKTAGFGYDGKGQVRIGSSDEGKSLIAKGGDWVLEQWQDFAKEVSVIVARGTTGRTADWGVIENRHQNHILDVSFAPALVDSAVRERAVKIATGIAERLQLVGLLCVEFFLLRNGELKVNEIAPRPHNSGHWTLEGSVTSQFEQQIRAICGMTLGSTQLLAPTAMANVLGDLWKKGEPRWEAVLGDPFVKWHSYGKREARPGRKMGHLTATGSTVEEAVARVTAARDRLTS